MNYHIAKKHSKATARTVHKCKVCDKDFHSFTMCENMSGSNMKQGGSEAQEVYVAHV